MSLRDSERDVERSKPQRTADLMKSCLQRMLPPKEVSTVWRAGKGQDS